MRAGTLVLVGSVCSIGIAAGGLWTARPAASSLPAAAERVDVAAALKRLPRSFEERREADGRVRFVSRTPEGTVVLSGDGATLTLPGSAAVRMRLAGGSQAPRAIPSDPLAGTTNYLIGRDPAAWRTNVKTFATVRFAGVYPDVDLVYYGRGRELEYDFIVKPGADPARIRLQFDGVGALALEESGGLRLRTGSRDIHMEPPHLYQETAHGRTAVGGRYVLAGSREVRFDVDAYDRRLPLVIDPVITYSTYFGGGGDDASPAIAVDEDGFIYFTGTTATFDTTIRIPTVHALQPAPGGSTDSFVTKLSPDGRTIIYSTFLGGQFPDTARAIAVDRRGRVYVAGSTVSPDFPQVNPLQPVCAASGREDAFVTKLNASGSALEYSTCLGGASETDEAFALAIDEAGDAYVAGMTFSKDFPTRNAIQPAHGDARVGTDAFVSVIRPDGSDLVYSRSSAAAASTKRTASRWTTGGTSTSPGARARRTFRSSGRSSRSFAARPTPSSRKSIAADRRSPTPPISAAPWG